MSEVATKNDITDLNNKIDESFSDLTDLLQTFMKQVDERFNEMETRYDHLINTIDGFVARIDKYEIEFAARDSQFEKLLVWARKVSDKTGIPLENL